MVGPLFTGCNVVKQFTWAWVGVRGRRCACVDVGRREWAWVVVGERGLALVCMGGRGWTWMGVGGGVLAWRGGGARGWARGWARVSVAFVACCHLLARSLNSSGPGRLGEA